MFEHLNLDRSLQLGLDALAFTEPTDVQEAMIPLALTGKDLRVSAETGSGKTLAYIVPVAQRILAETPARDGGTLGLILVPTRELARQVLKHCRRDNSWGKAAVCWRCVLVPPGAVVAREGDGPGGTTSSWATSASLASWSGH